MGRVPHKTNAMRLLDARAIPYTIASYAPSIHNASDVARAIGVPPATVFKTLVTLVDNTSRLLIMAPAEHELDLKRCAASVGAKRLRMATRAEAESRTGLLVGGISPLALIHRNFAVFLDRHALDHAAIWVSAGQRGYNLRITAADLLAVTGATIIDAVGD